MSDEFGGIDPPSTPIYTYSKIESNPTLSICKKCGCTHGMVLEEMATGKTEPLDVCKDCMFFGSVVRLEKQVVLHENCTELHQDCTESYVAEQYKKIMDYLFASYMHHIIMNGFDEQIIEVPGEWNEAYEKAYASQVEIWDRAEIDNRFVPVHLPYDPPQRTENHWRKLIADWQKMEEEYDKNISD